MLNRCFGTIDSLSLSVPLSSIVLLWSCVLVIFYVIKVGRT
jgi:hypothetical protein